MANLFRRLTEGIASIPGRVLRAAGWAHMEPTGYGAGPVHEGDLDEIEAERRRQREAWRRGVDEDEPPKPD
jgi:hypothetical protein